MPMMSRRCLRISGSRSCALAGRVMGAMMSGRAALARDTSVERSCGGSGHGMTSTMSHEGFAAAWAAWKPLALFWPKRSLQYISTTRFGETLASWNTSVKYWTAFLPNEEPVGKLRYTYWVFCWPSFTALATLAVMGSAAAMSTRNGTRRCWATGTIAWVDPESKEPISIWAPWLMTRSASVRPTSGLVWVSPRMRSIFIPLSDLIPPAELIASAAIWAPRRHACPGSGGLRARLQERAAVHSGRAGTIAHRFLRDVGGVERRSGPAQQVLGHDHALDLVRTLVDLGDLGVAHEALHRELAGVAVAAEDLDRVGGDLHGGVGGQALGRRGLERGAGDPVIDEARGVVHHQARGVHRHRHVREHELDALELGDRLVERAALLGVGDRGVQRGLGDSHRLGPDGGPRLLEGLHGDLEASALLAQPVLHRHLAVAEVQRHRRRTVDAELALGLAHREALRAGLDQQRGHALGPLAGLGGDEHGDDPRVGAVGHPHLGPVQHVAIALAHRPAGHRRRVGAGAGLGERERGGHLAGGQARQVAPLLLLAAAEDDRV